MTYAWNFKDLTGKRFHKWIVLERTDLKNRRDPIWKCKCDCGTIKLVAGNSLRNGSKSCGCIRENPENPRKRKYTFKELLASNIRARYRCDAEKRGYTFELTKDDVYQLIYKPCFYCNKDKSNRQKVGNTKKFSVKYTGIDRIDNSKGYTKDNTVPCCKPCNTIKNGITKEMIFKLYHYYFK